MAVKAESRATAWKMILPKVYQKLSPFASVQASSETNCSINSCIFSDAVGTQHSKGKVYICVSVNSFDPVHRAHASISRTRHHHGVCACQENIFPHLSHEVFLFLSCLSERLRYSPIKKRIACCFVCFAMF